MPDAISLPAPDYRLMESLVQTLLEQIRAATIMDTIGEDDAAILPVLRAAQAVHGRQMEPNRPRKPTLRLHASPE